MQKNSIGKFEIKTLKISSIMHYTVPYHKNMERNQSGLGSYIWVYFFKAPVCIFLFPIF